MAVSLQALPKKDSNVYSSEGNFVLQYNVCESATPFDIPDVFFKADAVFSVMAWRAGYKAFTENTIANGSDFSQYCEGISRIVRAIDKPTFIIANRHFVNKLHPQRVEEIKFDRFNSDDVCAIWNYDGEIPHHTTSLMIFIGQSFDTVLDFCCGYGEIASYVKHFILSDINTGCLEYVKRRYLYGKAEN